MSVPVVISLLVGTGLAAWLARRASRGVGRAARRFSALTRARRGLADVVPGPVALRGRIEAIDLVRSGVSGQQGVYVRTTCERWDDLPNTTGVGGKWIVSHRDEQAAPFELSDGAHAVLVDPEGADFRVPIRPCDNREPEMRYQEAVLETGTEVIVVGEARHEGGFRPTQTYRGHTFGTVVARGRDGLLIAVPSRLAARLLGSVALHALALLPVVALGGSTVVYVLSHLAASSAACEPLPAASTTARACPITGDDTPPREYQRLPWRGRRPVASVARRMQASAHLSPQRFVGRFTLRLRVVGIASPAVRNSIGDRVRRQLWRRRLSWLSDVQIVRRRRFIVVDEIVVTGRAVRDVGFWRSFCALHRDRCTGLALEGDLGGLSRGPSGPGS